MNSPFDGTGLLVSVRSASEALRALDAGAAVIDVKEPRRGALGAADLETIEAVVRAVAGRAPVSAALGELVDWNSRGAKIAVGLNYAKLGLAGCRRRDWRSRWRDATASFPAGVAPVAVAYADWAAADSPEPAEVLAAASEFGSPALLVDTFDKSAGDLFAHWPEEELAEFVAQVRARGLAVALAGSLAGESLSRAGRLAPDLVAIRGAACRPDRLGELCPRLVAHAVRAVAAAATVS